MSVLDIGYGRSALPSDRSMFGLHSVLGLSHKVDPQHDTSSSNDASKEPADSKASKRLTKSSSRSFLSKSSKRLTPETSFELSCDAAIRPSFCWNSHGDKWQPGGVWSQFDGGLKSCQDDAYMCTNFMGLSDAAFAGVFDGHGFNGRSAATYARKHTIRWLSVDSSITSKDPKRRLKALESVCTQIDRGLARPELCGFDSSSSGLTACFGSLQGNKICLVTQGNCKAVLGRADNGSTRLVAQDLSQEDSTQQRAISETSAQRPSPGVRPMKSMPMATPFANSAMPSEAMSESFLGRGRLGEPPGAAPVMTVHQLNSQAQFVVLATSGVWEVMTPQEVVDFVQQCRACRPQGLSCSAALTLEAHARWKLNFSKVIAEDVAAVIIHCGPVPPPAEPAHRLPAFPEAATTNHEANDDHSLHETREFWGRLQPQSLVPLLQTATSKGKTPMPSSLLEMQNSNSNSNQPQMAGNAKAASPDGYIYTSSSLGAASSSHARPRDSQSNPRDSLDSSRLGSQPDSSIHSSKGTTGGSRTVHFDLPSSDDSDTDRNQGSSSGKQFSPPQILQAELTSKAEAGARIRKSSPPMDISFRPDTPEAGNDYPCRIVSSSGHSSTSVLSGDSPEHATPPHKATAHSSPEQPASHQTAQKLKQLQPTAANPFLVASIAHVGSPEHSEEDSEHSLHGSSSSQSSRTPHKSPSRAHAQQPLVEGEAVKSTVMSIAKLSMIERTHSAPGGIPFGMLVDCHGAIGRPRRRMPEPIPEDRPVVPVVADVNAIDRPIRKIYPHGSGDLDVLEAEEAAQTKLCDLPTTATGHSAGSQMPTAEPEGRVHGKLYPTAHHLQSQDDLPRAQFPKGHANVTSVPGLAMDNLEGGRRAGFPRVASHPQNLSDVADATSADTQMLSPFARLPHMKSASSKATSSSHSPSSLQELGSSFKLDSSNSTAGSIDPWSSTFLANGSLLAQLENQRSSGSCTFGNRSRNSSAAFDELTKIRSGKYKSPDSSQVPVSSSM